MSGRKWQRTHTWRDRRGKVAFYHVRYLMPDGRVAFPFYVPAVGNATDTIKVGRDKVAAVRPGFPPEHKTLVYRLPTLLKAINGGVPEVWCCEGEKDADSLVKAGLVATTGWDGAGKWKPEQADWFKSYPGTVNVVIDNDNPGAAEGILKHDSLNALGVRVRLFRPGTNYKDVTDWLRGGNPVDELEELVVSDLRPLAKLVDISSYTGRDRLKGEMTLVESTPHPEEAVDDDYEHKVEVWRAVDRLRTERAARRILDQERATGLFAGFEGGTLTDFLAEEREPTPWLLRDLMRVGHKVVLTAGFKTGKTTLLANAVRSMVDGVPLFERFEPGWLAGNVAVFDYELTEEDAADLYTRIGMEHTRRVRLESLRGKGFTFANDHHCEMAVKHLRDKDCEVLVLDPFSRAMRGFGSENSNDDVGAFLGRIDEVVDQAGVRGVIITAHTGRAEQAVGAEHARGATRIDDDADARWLYSKEGSSSVRFFRADGRNRVAVDEFAVVWDPDTDRLAASDATRYDTKYRERAKAAARIVAGAPQGLSATDLQSQMAGSDEKPKRAAIKYAVRKGWLTEDVKGGRAGTLYTLGPVEFEEVRLHVP